MSMTEAKYPRYSRVRHPLLEEPYTVPSCVSQEIFDDAMSLTALPGDVYICAFPKCGTTWVQNALLTMRNEGRPLRSGEYVMDEIPFLEFVGKGPVENVKARPRIIKTHVYSEMVPQHDEAKYLVIARNPKDCFASYYHHAVGFENMFYFKDGKFGDCFEVVVKGAGDYGDYFKYTAEWWERSKVKNNVLFILYEDMNEDMQREFLKIVDFIGSGWSEKVRANNNELLKKMVEESSFDKMSESKNLFKLEGILYRPALSTPFVRRGVVGDWKNIFSEDQSRRVDERMKETGMKYPGFDHLWDKYSDYLRF